MELMILTLAKYALDAFYYLMIAYILMSWIPNLRDSRFGELVGRIVEPYLSIFRKFIPSLGGIDVSPIAAFIAYRFLSSMALIGLQTFINIVQKYI